MSETSEAIGQRPSRDFTIPQAFKVLGFECIPDDTWAAGKEMQKLYESVTGQLPEKRLAPKTAGGGSHCLAHYPPAWWDKAAKIVRLFASRRARQQSLL